MGSFDRGCWLIFLAALGWMAWVDQRTKKISNRGLLFLFAIRTYVLLADGEEMGIVEAFWGFWIGGGIIFLVYWVTKGGVGAGDVKLLAVVGYFVGGERVWDVIFWSVLTAGGWSVCRGMKRVPMAPFVLVGVVITIGIGGIG